MAPENDTPPPAPDASSAPAVDAASGAVEPAGANPSGGTAEVTTTMSDGGVVYAQAPGAAAPPVPPSQEQAAVTGVTPPPDPGAGVPPEGAAPAEDGKAEPDPVVTEGDDLVTKKLDDEAALEEGDVVEGQPHTAEEAAAPPEHPEPVPAAIGVLQDNVSEPGVEKTTTRDADGLVTSEHATSTGPDGIPQTDEAIAEYREKVMADGDKADAEAETASP